jgi:tetratricopeptide (TPR) repeat protein
MAGILGQVSRAEITDRHREVVKEVSDRLLAVMDPPEHWEVWPPEVTVTDPGFANAFAGFKTNKDGVQIPFVEVTVTTIEEIAKFDGETLAFTIGHELGHLYHDHSRKSVAFQEQFGNELPTVRLACGREQEFEADLYGMQLAFKAGYTRRGLMTDLQGWRSSTPPYCRYEGLSGTHPAWDDRAIYLMQDEQQRTLWGSLSSFQTGVMFLENHHYTHAEICFQEVTEDFPNCYEAWANLGYALLMQYCDALEAEDIRNMDIGHLVVGGFYRRPESLAPLVRGPDEDLWFEAVGAFREALRLKERMRLDDDMLMVKANLAVAYLIHPGGKDVGQAERWFTQVFDILQDEQKAKDLDPLVHVSILINSGSARGFNNDLVAETLRLLAKAKTVRGNGSAVEQMESALRFNQARALHAGGEQKLQQTALKLYESYLDGMTSSSAWWPLAYEQYHQLAQAAGVNPKKQSEFRKPGIKDWRPVTIVKLKDDKSVGLSQSIESVLENLGPADVEIPVIEGTNLKYYVYSQHGIRILATREVLAVILESEAAPQITVSRPGLGSENVTIGLGMPRADLEALFGSDWDVDLTHLFDTSELHQLYRELGLAAQFKGGVVSELVVSVVPTE